jgi:hypothetical protein
MRQRHTAFIRQWRILQRLAQAHGSLTLKDFDDIRLAEGVISKTIKRDIDGVLAAVWPIQRDERNGLLRWELDRTAEVPFVDRPLIPQEKVCRSCRESKPLEEFHKLASSLDGRSWECAKCHCERQKRWYDLNRDRALKRMRYLYRRSGRRRKRIARA